MSIENIIALIAALGLGGILGALLNSYLEKRKQSQEHDKRIFQESNEILTEQKLLEISNVGLIQNNTIDYDSYRKIKGWCMFFGEAGNQFLNKKLVKLSQELLNDLSVLVIYIEDRFFTKQRQEAGNKNNLRPITNIVPNDTISENMQEYLNGLEELIEKALNRYGNFRYTIKQILKI